MKVVALYRCHNLRTECPNWLAECTFAKPWQNTWKLTDPKDFDCPTCGDPRSIWQETFVLKPVRESEVAPGQPLIMPAAVARTV